MWVATQDLPRRAAHPFYTRLNEILDANNFDGYVEGLCQRFYADDGRPGLPPRALLPAVADEYAAAGDRRRRTVRISPDLRPRSLARPRTSSHKRSQHRRAACTPAEVTQTVDAVLDAGVVGINIEDRSVRHWCDRHVCRI